MQADGKKFRYFGHLQVLESEMRPEVLHAHLRAVCEKKFFNPANPPKKKTSVAPEPVAFIPMPAFDLAFVDFALCTLNEQPNAESEGVRIAEVAGILTKEMSLGNVNPADFGPLVEAWINGEYLEKVTSDKVRVTAKGKALFETATPATAAPPSTTPPPTPETIVALPPVILQTLPPALERNGKHHPSVPSSAVPTNQPLPQFLAGMQSVLRMAQELGQALRETETISGKIDETDKAIAQMEKALREHRKHREELETQRAEHLRITASEDHKAARTFVLQLRGASLDRVG